MSAKSRNSNLPETAKSNTQLARLIPVVADSKKEERATSILLACMSSIQNYAAVMLSTLGHRVGKRSQVICFTEVEFDSGKKDLDESKCRPDGLIVLRKSSKDKPWRCIVEAKVGNEEIRPEQLERYVTLAKNNDIDAVLTISNQFVALPSHVPVKLPRSVVKGVSVFHWSWISAVTQAELLCSGRTIENEKDQYILTEMLRYFSDKSSGISSFDSMNKGWGELVKRLSSGEAIKRTDPSLENAVADWHQETRDLCLMMSRQLDVPVGISLPRAHKDDQLKRLKDDCETLAKNHKLCARLDIPDAAATLEIVAHVGRRWLVIFMTLIAPKDKKKATARINWLLRQLNNATSDEIQISANWPGRAAQTTKRLSVVREDPESLVDNQSLSPTSFEVVMLRDLAGKFSKPQIFIQQLEELASNYYKEVGQHLRAYVPSPPKPRKPAEPAGDDKAEKLTEEQEKSAEGDRYSEKYEGRDPAIHIPEAFPWGSKY